MVREENKKLKKKIKKFRSLQQQALFFLPANSQRNKNQTKPSSSLFY
jgi:hypothetical protein